MRRDRFESAPQDAKIRGTVITLRSTDGQKDTFGVWHGLGRHGAEHEPTRLRVTDHEFRQAGFIDRNDSFLQSIDLLDVHVNAGDVIPTVRETGACHEPDITCSDHDNFHRHFLQQLSDNLRCTLIVSSQAAHPKFNFNSASRRVW